MNLKDKVAIVTGASKGIGKTIALTLAREGANVAISARSEALLNQVATQIEALGSEAYVFNGDMRQEDAIKKLIHSTAEKFRRIDILVNNAGMGHFGRIAELTTAQWDEMFDLNMRGVFIATREALPYLREAGESVVVNVASLAGKNAFIGGGGYAATKHALLGFNNCLMLEERKNGVRVLAICPGSVATEFSPHEGKKAENILQSQDVADSILHMLKLPQNAMVSEIDIRPTNP